MIIIWVGGSSGEENRDKHDLQLAQSFTEVQDACENVNSFLAVHSISEWNEKKTF